MFGLGGLIVYVLMALLAGQYISFVKAGQTCPDGNCANVTLKGILTKGLLYALIAPFYMFYKLFPLVKRFGGDKFDWMDF